MAAVDVGTRTDTIGNGQYDDAVEDFYRDLDIPGPEQNPSYNGPILEPAVKDIDEEIKITKKRKPIAKLDADRLLSEKGVPELRRRARKRMKFSGKGHEFDDMSSLLQMYQMWLDDLYPKAKFRDGLAMIEKVGHSKRLNVMRKSWIQNTRPAPPEEPDVDDDDGPDEQADRDDLDAIFGQARSGVQERLNARASENSPVAPDEDELDMLLAQEAGPVSQDTATTRTRQPFDDDDESDQDELDALLDQESSKAASAAVSIQPVIVAADNFEDDEEAMMEMGL